MKEIPTQDDNAIYALHYKGKLLGTFKWSYFGLGNTSGLYGWRPPKKVYFKLGLARSGAGHLPKEILDDIEIVKYLPAEVVEKLDSKEPERKKVRADIKKLERLEKVWKQRSKEETEKQNLGLAKDFEENVETFRKKKEVLLTLLENLG